MRRSVFVKPLIPFFPSAKYIQLNKQPFNRLTSPTMSCAIGNVFIAMAGGLLDRSKRRKSIYVARPLAVMPNRVARDSNTSLSIQDQQQAFGQS
jgi:hypothetical protein